MRPNTKILVDGGDPAETERVKNLIGFVDGQTTNPTLVAKNPHIAELIASGHKLTKEEEQEEYKKIVTAISPLVGDAGVSIEVYADLDTKAETMVEQAREMFSWIPNAYIKYPCIHEGLRAAQLSVAEGIRVNMTLVFSQEQAAAVYAATLGAKNPVYVSPFVGRLDDRGEDGMELIANIKKMFSEQGDGHVKVLMASVRNINHLMYGLSLGTDLATVPTAVLEEWVKQGMPLPDSSYKYDPAGKKEIPYLQLDLTKPWESFNIQHDLTTVGVKKFVEDYKNTLQPGE